MRKESPILLRRRLARRLRNMREDAGLSLAEAAPLLDKTRSALGRIEKAETIADVHLIRSAMDTYQAYDSEVLELARAAMQPGWWQAYGVRDRGFVSLETDAVRSRELALVRLPALLQDEGYLRALLDSTRSDVQLENECTVRLIRQQRLTDVDAPLELIVLIDESALRKSVGGPSVMRAQFRYLLECVELNTVTVGVLPDSIGAHAGMNGAFTVLEFDDDADPDTLSVGYVTGAARIEKPAEVGEARDILDKLWSTALTPAESADFIERLGKERYSM